MVLRFHISSVGEAEALVEAIDVLILDVWEFTADWVDIRLSKDIVSLPVTLRREPLLTRCLLGPLALGPAAPLSSTCSHPIDA